MALDGYGRHISYLRVSVTDRCNLRCRYCMPPEGVQCRPHDEILRYEEIARVVRCAVDLGVRKVRLTGGEPLARKGLVSLVAMLREIDGLDELAMTTNGTMLADHAVALAEAGLDRVNVSLDTLDPGRYEYITRGGRLGDVFEGLAAAEAAGLAPIKLNCVVVRSFNDDEVADLAALTLAHDWAVRFIELMPLGPGLSEPVGEPVPSAEIRRRLVERYGALVAEPDADGAPTRGPARYARLPGGVGTVGFISPLTEHFCAECNRLRLTADGRLRLCLLDDVEVGLRDLLRSGADDAALREAISAAVALKPWGHQLARDLAPEGRAMSQIGG